MSRKILFHFFLLVLSLFLINSISGNTTLADKNIEMVKTDYEIRRMLYEVIKANRFRHEVPDSIVAIETKWINLDHSVANKYSKYFYSGRNPHRKRFARDIYSKHIYYFNNSTYFLILHVTIHNHQELENVPAMHVVVGDEKVAPYKISERNTIIESKDGVYSEDNVNFEDAKKEIPKELFYYFEKYEVGEIFTRAEEGKGENALRLDVKIPTRGKVDHLEKVFPFNNSPEKIVRIRNLMLEELNTKAHNYKLWGEDWWKFVYKPGRQIILPKHIKFRK